jgi:2-C-methyl-D-erythritol 4-phosphate cytidylyltransferase
MNFGIILAGGVGNRMKMDIPKQYIVVEGKPVLIYTLEQYEQCDRIDRFVIVADEPWRKDILNWIQQYRITKFLDFADPGPSRQESVFSGLNCCMKYSKSEDDVVVVHESARALASVQLVTDIVDGLKGYDGCLPVLPMKDSIILSEDGTVIDQLLDRAKLFRGQAPESFYLHPYWKLNNEATQQELAETRGDHELCFRKGWRVRSILGEENNFKLTTPEDINLMISILRNETVKPTR